MAGGIQPGTTAWDKRSRKLNQIVGEVAKTLASNYNGTLTFHKKIPNNMLFEGTGACEPDGGLFFKNGKLLAAFEAKKQGPAGNAIERWYKNKDYIEYLNPEIPYVTFCTGEGCEVGKPIHNILHLAVRGEFNVIRKTGPSIFLKVEDWEYQEVYDIMSNFLLSQVKKSS